MRRRVRFSGAGTKVRLSRWALCHDNDERKTMTTNDAKAHISQEMQLLLNIRIQAQIIWRGPTNLVIDYPNGSFFFGWPMLSLELEHHKTDQVESRSVYA